MNRIRIFKSLIVLPLITLSLMLSGCYDNAWESHVSSEELLKNNLVNVMSTKPELSIFVSLLKKTGYDQVLQTANSFTVFAPTNEAWGVGTDTLNVDSLRKMIGSVIVYKSYYSTNQSLYTSIKSVNGKNIYYNSADSTFNGAKIKTFDIRAANGVLQITDKLLERRNSIWEFLSENTNFLQYQFINGLNKKILDPVKSIAVGVDALGKTKYDTVWMNINNFLQKYPIDNEDSIFTYIVVENDGFNLMYNKYNNANHKYFNMNSVAQTDSATRFNVCQDFVFRGIVDITKFDTLTNVDGVKVPINGSVIKQTYNSSNGRVYVIDKSNIRLKDKIKPIKIEGESFTNSTNTNYVFTRYKLWASGQRDIAMASGETQSDSLYRKLTGKKDSVVSKTYFLNSNLVANVANFYIEYKAKVNSANYDIYYVAYDDIADHFDPTYTRYGVYKIIQKLFISMPGSKTLTRGAVTSDAGNTNTSGVINNYLGNARCFVGEGRAGVMEITKLKQWDLEPVNATQMVSAPVSPLADVMTVSKTGTLTMWLCNTARSNTASRQGLLFLDYILLVPRITEE